MINEIVDKATSQIGYVEGKNNDTFYGRDYGMNYNPWCHMFIWWIANQVGVGADIVPKTASCPTGYRWFRDRGQIVPAINARKGDIIYIQWNKSRNADHVGIIEKAVGDTIITIEGNREDKVKRCTYSKSSSSIFAIARPAYIENEKVQEIKGEDFEVKTYKNGSTIEPVYQDTACNVKIGSLNQYEQCECYGIVNGMYMVSYNVDGTNYKKVGFVKYNGEIS